MESLGLMFVFIKLADAFRVVPKINKIFLTLVESQGLLTLFMSALVVLNTLLVPLAQAIWGTYFIAYKTFTDANVSVLMITYSKGELEYLLDINFIWSLNFMLMYYFICIFIFHAAFH
jgi:hypothetical protein